MIAKIALAGANPLLPELMTDVKVTIAMVINSDKPVDAIDLWTAPFDNRPLSKLGFCFGMGPVELVLCFDQHRSGGRSIYGPGALSRWWFTPDLWSGSTVPKDRCSAGS